ncbi:MAG: PPC domain-containing DNA-binding protein [Candidatus Saliniplasma sp.]
MQFKKEGNILVAKLDDGADIFDTLREIMDRIGERSAMLISGIGMITDFKLGYYNSETGDYEWEQYAEPMELLSMKGSFTADGTIHIHAEVSGPDHDVKGGHLDGGRVFNVNEITMLVFDEIEMIRELDEVRDMTLLAFR